MFRSSWSRRGRRRPIDRRPRCRLRHKLGDDPRKPRRLKTVRGVGYVLTQDDR
ncbi:MAG: helix-turn-helix domain-containing protein [Myxococcota bacterium]|nr:helix-turn-helix domain-containing protein [Myxococcota bacterium]